MYLPTFYKLFHEGLVHGATRHLALAAPIGLWCKFWN